MASSVISDLISALDDPKSRWGSNPLFLYELNQLKFKLRNLKAFVLCARKLGNDPHLGSLVELIGDAANRYLRDIHSLPDITTAAVRFRMIVDEIVCFEENLEEQYITLLDPRQQSGSLTEDEILEITDTILGNVADCSSVFRNPSSHLVVWSLTEALGEQMTFLKNFLRFGLQTSGEPGQLEDLLTHFEAVAIDAARLFIQGPVDESDEKWFEDMQLKCYMLLEKIKPVDPQVCRTYTQALSSLKLCRRPTQDKDDGSVVVLTNFLGSLISDLWDLLRLDNCHLDSIKDQRQVLYEGLRFLRTILKQKPEVFDEKIRDRIRVVACDAGVFICSFHQTHVECNPELQNLLERIKTIHSEVEDKVPETSIPNFPSINELGFFDSLLENLMVELTNWNGEPITKSLVHTLREELACLRPFLKETEELRNGKEEIQALRNRVLEVAYKVEFVIDRLTVGDVSDSHPVFADSIIEEIRDIKSKTALLQIRDGNRKDMVVKNVIRTLNHQASRSTTSLKDEAVGFDDKAYVIVEQLRRGSEHLRMALICGMGGIGKTTLASKVYNHQSIKHHFQARAWCPVSQVLDKRRVFIELLNQIDEVTLRLLADKRKELLKLLEQIDHIRFSQMTEKDLADKGKILNEFLSQISLMTEQDSTNKQREFCELLDKVDPEGYSKMTEKDKADTREVLTKLLNQVYPKSYYEMTEFELADRVRRGLKGRKYLIFLDDLWTIEHWNSFSESLAFPNDTNGSRILVTSRHENVAPSKMLLDGKLHSLPLLTVEESFNLLQSKLPHVKDWSHALSELGTQIAARCKGLPLTIVTVAGLLATEGQERWREILDGLGSDKESVTEQCTKTLELSYKYLPDHLKPCFLYFGAFAEDQEVFVRRLTRLWIAEGFVPKPEQPELERKEEVAEKHLRELIGRSLVMVVKERSTSGAKTCRIHDLVHQFCLRKAEEENFFHLLKEHDQLSDFNEPCYLRRLCIDYDGDHIIKESKLFCPRARSLLFFSSSEKKSKYEPYWLATSFIVPIFKFLKVLDLEQINLGDVFPSEIQLLLRLTYLSVRGNIEVIPALIGELLNLETFVVHLVSTQVKVSLPHTLWNLKKLKCLHINSGGGILPIENIENSSVLLELESFSGAVIYSRSSMEDQMQKFPNIRRLKCDLSQLFVQDQKFDKIVVPDLLDKLESLHLLRSDLMVVKDVIFDFVLPAQLKKLTLSRFELPWSKISAIGKRLTKLEVLKLLDSCFVGDTWVMEEGAFLELRLLKLSKLNIVEWNADDLPSLKELVLDHCSNLEVIPFCLGDSPMLEMIVVSSCSETLVSSVEEIGEKQKELGNPPIKISIM